MENSLQKNVAFVISRNYIGQFKVTFNSLFNANTDIQFLVHLFHNDLSNDDIDDIKSFVFERNSKIAFYKISDELFSGLPKMQNDNSYSAYYKTLLPYYLSHLDKVLFLDCDIIVRGNVKPLFEKEQDEFLSWVPDYKINKKRQDHIVNIVGEKSIYYNSGVMLLDFKKSESIVPQDEMLKYIAESSHLIRWHDQDILNHFYAKKSGTLDEKYNYLATYKSIKDLFFPKGKKNAVIVHYANWKPWRSNYIGKCYRLYKKNYDKLSGEKSVDFLKKRNLIAQLKLIFSYIFR